MDPTTDHESLSFGQIMTNHHHHLIMRMLKRQCWLCNHASSQTKEPFTFLQILSLGQGPEWSFRKSIVTSDQLEEQWIPNYDNLCDIRLIIKEVDSGGHTYRYAKLWKIHILYCPITFCPSTPFKWIGQVFLMKFKIFVLQPNFQVFLLNYFQFPFGNSTTAHAFPWFEAVQFVAQVFCRFVMAQFLFCMAYWRRSWWDQSLEACLECHYDTFDRVRCMDILWHRSVSICSRSML